MSTNNPNSGQKLVVIGAGPGGYPAAFHAAHLGFDVTLVDENDTLGGVCLNVGCIPSKALLHVAKLIHESQAAKKWGITFAPPEIDIDKLRAYKEKVIKQLTGGLATMAKAHGVATVQGRARFIDNQSLSITDAQGATQTLPFDHCIIATGSKPAMPPMMRLDTDRVMDSTGALKLADIPKTMLVVGGGYIGLEMGAVYAALGTEVTVVEMTQGLLPGADRDLVAILQRRLKRDFKEILLDTRVTEMSATDNAVNVKMLGLDLKEPDRRFDRVLVTVGRSPNSADLGLENINATLDERGFILVDAQRRVGESNIYAIGDVAGEPGLAHKATHEGGVASRVAAGEAAAYDPACIPAVVFTDPEIAWVGLTETQALNANIEHRVVTFPWAASGRAISLDRTDGLTKIIIDPQTHRILGLGLVGVGAGDLISEGALAIEMGATAKDLAMTIHPHPTLSETIMEAAELYQGFSAHYIPRKPKIR